MTDEAAKNIQVVEKSIKVFRDAAGKYSADIKPWKVKYEDYKKKRKEAYQVSKGKYVEINKKKKELKVRIQQITAELEKLDDELSRTSDELNKEKETITKTSAALTMARAVLSHLPDLEKMANSLSRISQISRNQLERLEKQWQSAARDDKDVYARSIKAFNAEFDKANEEADTVIELLQVFRIEDMKFDESFERFSISVKHDQ
jgi:chromosome segregation ATPase